MPSYSSLADLKTYLNISATSDDDLLQTILDAATNRIDSLCGRLFQAAANTTRYYDPTLDVHGNDLYLDEDLSYVSAVTDGASVDITSSTYVNPRNATPYYSIGIKRSTSYYWTYTTDPQNSISVTGRFAYMERAAITALVRATNVVTATVVAPRLSVGASVFVLAVADTGFNGTFTVVSNTGSAITWAQTGADDTDTTGVMLYTPTDILTACRRLAAWMYRQKDTQQGDVDRPILAGDGSVIMPTTLPNDVETILRPYVRVVRN